MANFNYWDYIAKDAEKSVNLFSDWMNKLASSFPSLKKYSLGNIDTNYETYKSNSSAYTDSSGGSSSSGGTGSTGIKEILEEIKKSLNITLDNSGTIGQIVGGLFGKGSDFKWEEFGNNFIKDLSSSLAGAGVGYASNLIGQGITSIGGDTRISRGIGTGLATGLGSVGGTVVSNLIKHGNILGNANKLFQTGGKGWKAFSNIKNVTETTAAGKNITKTTGAFNPYALGMSVVGAGLEAAFGPSKEYEGRYGGITQGMDTAYDIVQTGVGFVPGFGQAISGAMALNKGLSNIFGSTSGMCVCAGTKVYTADGRYINIEDLKQEDGILGWNEKTHEIRPLKIECFIEPRLKECLELELDNGRTLRCSIDHPILSNIKEKAESHYIEGKRIAYRNWEFRRADELQVGNWVGLANNVDYWGNKEMPNAYLVGMLIGDGTYTYESSCKLWTADSSTWKYLEENNLAVLTGQYTPENSNGKYSIEIREYRIINGMLLVKNLGIAYLKRAGKTLPKNIDSYNKDSICKLIAGLFDTDGSFSGNIEKKLYSVTLYLSNLLLLKDVLHLLYKMGIMSSISTRKASINKMKNGRIINSNISYRLELTDRRSILKFRELIPINIDYKKANLDVVCEIVFPKKNKDHYELSGARQAKIVNITPIGMLTVYNLTVSEDHTYLANDIITHNTVQDAILGSAFMPAPIKWLNAGFSSDTGNFDNLSWQNTELTNNFMQDGFGDLGDKFKRAREEANKTWGLFSQGEKRSALRNIDFSNMAFEKILDMAHLNQYQKIRSNDMATINNQRYMQSINGGWNSVARGKYGMKILNNATNHNIGMRLLSGAALIDNKAMILSNFNGDFVFVGK